MNFDRISSRIIQYSFYLLFFFVPLIMTPWNYELFEYNKMMMVYGFTVIIATTWIIKMVVNKKFLLHKTPFDIPIILFLTSQILSTVFSIDVHTSIFGYYSRFHGGLLSTISYIVLFYALVSHLDKSKIITAIRFLLTAGLIVGLYGIAEHYGIDAKYWVQDVRSRVFSTLGQPNWLAAWMAVIVPVPLAMAYISKLKKTSTVTVIFYLVTFLIFILTTIFTKSRSGIPSAFFSILIFLFFMAIPKIVAYKKQFTLPLFAIFIAILIIGGIFGTNKLFNNAFSDIPYIFGLSPNVNLAAQNPWEGGSSSGDIRKVVWRGAVEIFKANPLLGSGVETFAYSYYQYRPVEHNLLSEWDFLYNKAHNEYFNFLATTGAVGFGSYIIFITWVIVWNIKNIVKKDLDQLGQLEVRAIMAALFSGWLSILITNFFGFSVVPVALLFFLFPAMSYILSQLEPPITENKQHNQPFDNSQGKQSTMNNKPLNINTDQWVISGLITIVGLMLLSRLGSMWYADKLFASGNTLEKQGQYENAANALIQAVKNNPGEPLYHDELGYTYSALAIMTASQNLTDKTSEFVNLSVSESDIALKTSPRNLNFWRTRAKIYYNLARLDTKYVTEAKNTLEEAIKIAPTDAKLLYNLGVVNYQLGKKEDAVKILEKTVTLKSNYYDPRFALSIVYDELGQRPKAIEELKYILKYIDPVSTATKQKLTDWGINPSK